MLRNPYSLERRSDWQESRETFGPTLTIIGVHATDLIRWFNGREFTEVMAAQLNVGHPEVNQMEDSAVMIPEMDNGGFGCVHLDYCRPLKAQTCGDDLLGIAGNKGVIETFNHGSRVQLTTHETECREPDLDQPVDELLNFVNAAKGTELCEAPVSDCFRITEIVLKARESCNLLQPVKL